MALNEMLGVCVVVYAVVGTAEPRNVLPDERLHELVTWISGSFSSEAQAESDSAFLDIRLHMVPIWVDREDGHWLYVEQAVAWSQDHPYRQRVYHVVHVGNDLFESQVFELCNPLRFVGAWKESTPLAGLTPDSLDARQGCAIILRWMGDRFVGSTLGRLCESTLRGAAYATSEVEITESRLVSWDRGFASDGTQVWGAESGGYVFGKLESYPLR